MSSNIIDQLSKKSDAPSEKVKTSGGLDDIEDPVVTNIDTVDKEYKSIKCGWGSKHFSYISKKLY